MKEVNSKAIDPNCGTMVDMSTHIKTEQDGRLIYFCSDHCMRTFLTLHTDENPGAACD